MMVQDMSLGQLYDVHFLPGQTDFSLHTNVKELCIVVTPKETRQVQLLLQMAGFWKCK
jgi:hypothetical protein